MIDVDSAANGSGEADDNARILQAGGNGTTVSAAKVVQDEAMATK